ncbi:ANR family transcriptional regulator [Vibrio parahaemolyticus]|nr:ANR family transcriptional regulator [Vibrio parahaemolyticus]
MIRKNARYLELAQRACNLEQGEYWKEASEYWRQAMSYAATEGNLRWSEARARYCAARAGTRYIQIDDVKDELYQ